MSDVIEKTQAQQVTFPTPGDLFMNRFQIESVLNRGGFGCVYKALQLDLKRPVAIKVLRPASRIGFNDDASAEERRLEVVAKRFEREAQLVSQLRDAHTVMMYEYGQTTDGLLFMVLEYISGRALSEVVEDDGALGEERSVAIVLQVLSSLEEAHARGMLHRDIKPPNIMLYDHLGRRDQVKVLDFGLAKSMDDPLFSADDPDLTDDEVLIGTPRYMSPEQIRGHRLSPATDLNSLGLVFYELLAGEKAVMAKSTMNTLARHINEVPICLPDHTHIDPSLAAIVHKMIEKDVNKRFASAADVIRALEAWKASSFLDIEFEEIEEMPEMEEIVAPPDNRRWIVVGIVALLAIFGLAILLWPSEAEVPVEPTVPPVDPVVTQVSETATEPVKQDEQVEPEAEVPTVETEEIVVETEDVPVVDDVDPNPEPVATKPVKEEKKTKQSKTWRKPNLTTLP